MVPSFIRTCTSRRTGRQGQGVDWREDAEIVIGSEPTTCCRASDKIPSKAPDACVGCASEEVLRLARLSAGCTGKTSRPREPRPSGRAMTRHKGDTACNRRPGGTGEFARRDCLSSVTQNIPASVILVLATSVRSWSSFIKGTRRYTLRAPVPLSRR